MRLDIAKADTQLPVKPNTVFTITRCWAFPTAIAPLKDGQYAHRNNVPIMVITSTKLKRSGVQKRKEREKKLTKNEKAEIRAMKREDKLKPKPKSKPKAKHKVKKETNVTSKKTKEYIYFDDIDKEHFEGRQCVYIDPGKRDLLTMLGDNGKFYQYSNRKNVM